MQSAKTVKMIEFFIFLFAFCVFAVAAAGTARLFLITIQRGQIFGRWQNVLARMDRSGHEFWYKSLGGCSTCCRQRWSELTFIAWSVIWNAKSGHWILHDVSIGGHFLTAALRVLLAAMIFVLFCGMSFIIGNHLEHEKKIVESLEKQYPDRTIHRQTPQQK